MEIERPEPDMRFSLPISWHILKHIQNNGDKKRLRQVCRNFRIAIDQLIGLRLKVNPKNKAKIFDSHIIRQCTSIKIYGGSGILPWYTCPFPTTKLQEVAIHGEITVDNWILMTRKCKSIEKMTIEFQKEPIKGSNNILDWSSWSESQQFRIDLNLTRLFIKGAFHSLDFQCRAFVNLLGTTSIPQLGQLVIIKDVGSVFNLSPALIASVLNMKQNCGCFKTFGFVDFHSKYSKMDYWDTLWLNRKDALVIQHSYSEWRQVINLFHEDTNLDEVHYDLASRGNDFIQFDNNIQNTGRFSKNIRTLSLRNITSRWANFGALSLDLASLRLLEKLKTLEIKQRKSYTYNPKPKIRNLMLPLLLEKVSFQSVPVTNEILRTILQQCLRIEEICIRNQSSTGSYNEVFKTSTLTRPNIERALNHPTLKILVLDLSCEPRVRHILSILDDNLEDQSSILRQKKKSPAETIICTFQRSGNFVPVDATPPRRLTGKIHLCPLNTATMALVNLNNVTEAQLSEFEKEYN